MTPLEFATGLLDRGVELLARNGRLRVWPSKAFSSFTPAERAFLRSHRDELLALVPTLPQTTVEWSPPRTAPDVVAQQSGETGEWLNVTTDSVTPCRYCYATPCIGSGHPAYGTLHALDPIVSAVGTPRFMVRIDTWGRR